MTIAQSTARPRRSQAADVMSGVTRLRGKDLARVVARKQRPYAPIDTWQTFEERRAALAQRIQAGHTPGIWQTFDLISSGTLLRMKDLEARVKALEAEIATKATARAAPADAAKSLKPLRLTLMRTITDASVAPLIQKLEASRGRDVHLSVESPGGEILAAQKLAAAIELHGACDTTAIMACDSSATLVYSAGRRRSAMKDASFYFHAPTLAGKPAQTAVDQRRLDRLARDMSAFVAKRAGCKPRTILAMMTEEGRVLDTIAASNLGLVNAVIKRGYVPRKGRKL